MRCRKRRSYLLHCIVAASGGVSYLRASWLRFPWPRCAVFAGSFPHCVVNFACFEMSFGDIFEAQISTAFFPLSMEKFSVYVHLYTYIDLYLYNMNTYIFL